MDMGAADSLRAALVERLELGRRVVKEYQYVTTEMLRRSTVWHRIVSSRPDDGTNIIANPRSLIKITIPVVSPTGHS